MLTLIFYSYYKFKIKIANETASDIKTSDKIEISNIAEGSKPIDTSQTQNSQIQNSQTQNIQTQKINYDDNIGYLTIPDILLENAPIKENTNLETLSQAIGHFTNTSIYQGNVGLASHNGGGQGDYFKNLKNIKIGSKIYYQTKYGTKKYIVNTKVEIQENDFSYLKKTEDNKITLITCIKNQKEKRLCVQAVEDTTKV